MSNSNEAKIRSEEKPVDSSVSVGRKTVMSDVMLGTILCILSDVIFSLSYFFVRWLTTYKEVSGDWTLCFKELITTAFAFPIFLILWQQGRCKFPPIKITILILIAAFFCEFVGVRSHIAAYASIGMLLGLPVIRTFTILGTAGIGAGFLRERITLLKTLTMLILFLAIFALAFSQSTGSGMKIDLSPIYLYGFGAALLTGFGYAMYTVLLRAILRRAATESQGNEPVPIFYIVSLVCGFGGLLGGIFLVCQHGFDSLWNVPRFCWLLVFLAGSLNVICFYLKNLSLRYATASKVALFSVIQIVLGTIFGICFFGEATNTLVWVGLSLSTLGIALASQTK